MKKNPRDRLSRDRERARLPGGCGTGPDCRSITLIFSGTGRTKRPFPKRNLTRRSPKYSEKTAGSSTATSAGRWNGDWRNATRYFFSICRLRTALRAWKHASVRSAKICRGSRRSSTRNSASLSRIFPRPGFPTSMRCWKSTGIKRSPYFIPAPSVKSIKYQRRKPDDSTLEDRYERNKPNRPFRPAVRGA